MDPKHPNTDFKDLDKLGRREAPREAMAYPDYRRYVKDRPVIADAVYDRPFRRLQQLEERFPALAAVSSPTRRVGAGPAASCSTRVTELDEGQFMDLIHSSEGD